MDNQTKAIISGNWMQVQVLQGAAVFGDGWPSTGIKKSIGTRRKFITNNRQFSSGTQRRS